MRRLDAQPDETARVGASALTLAGIVKSWGPRQVLRGVELELEPGTVVSIAGANGAGKTTLLRIAAGLIMPEAGTVRVEALDPERERTEFQRRVGFLSAGNTGLYARLKADHHMELWARLALMPKRTHADAIDRAVAMFGLADLRDRRVDRLSMGQRQRLRLALAFLHGPRVVFLDEPATSLDGEGIAALQAALDDLKERGGAGIVCLPSGWDDVIAVERHLVLADGVLQPA